MRRRLPVSTRSDTFGPVTARVPSARSPPRFGLLSADLDRFARRRAACATIGTTPHVRRRYADGCHSTRRSHLEWRPRLGKRDRQRSLERTRSEENTSELQSLMLSLYAVFCLKKQKTHHTKAR